jgi:hypothetical protein
MQTEVKTLVGALGALAAAAIAVLKIFEVVDWTDAQTALVAAEAGAIIALGGALVAHFRKGTTQEPVALAASLTAVAAATVALGAGFDWWDWTEEQLSAVLSLITALGGVGGALVARNEVKAETTGQ